MHFYISCHCSLHIKQKAAEHEPFSCYAKSVKKKKQNVRALLPPSEDGHTKGPETPKLMFLHNYMNRF